MRKVVVDTAIIMLFVLMHLFLFCSCWDAIRCAAIDRFDVNAYMPLKATFVLSACLLASPWLGRFNMIMDMIGVIFCYP